MMQVLPPVGSPAAAAAALSARRSRTLLIVAVALVALVVLSWNFHIVDHSGGGGGSSGFSFSGAGDARGADGGDAALSARRRYDAALETRRQRVVAAAVAELASDVQEVADSVAAHDGADGGGSASFLVIWNRAFIAASDVAMSLQRDYYATLAEAEFKKVVADGSLAADPPGSSGGGDRLVKQSFFPSHAELEEARVAFMRRFWAFALTPPPAPAAKRSGSSVDHAADDGTDSDHELCFTADRADVDPAASPSTPAAFVNPLRQRDLVRARRSGRGSSNESASWRAACERVDSFVVFVETYDVFWFADAIRASRHAPHAVDITAPVGRPGSVQRRFVLVTGWTDPGPRAMFGADTVQSLLSLPALKTWWAQNCDAAAAAAGGGADVAAANKMRCLPIGVDWHTVARGARWGLPRLSALQQARRMARVAASAPPKFPDRLGSEPPSLLSPRSVAAFSSFRVNAVVMDFALGSNTWERLDLYWRLGLSWLTKVVWAGASRDAVWANYVDYRFVLSPPGNGYECHRTYEAMALGAVPIMLAPRDAAMRVAVSDLYRDTPVVFVDDFVRDMTWAALATWNARSAAFWADAKRVARLREVMSNAYWVRAIRRSARASFEPSTA
jgi:hypothetical protein